MRTPLDHIDNKSNGNEENTELQKSEKPQLPERRKPAKDERPELPKSEKPERVKRIFGELPKRVMLPKDKKPKFPQLVMGDNKANGIESILNESCLSEISVDEEGATIVSKKEMPRIPSNGMGLLSNVMKIELPKSENLERLKHVMPEPLKNEKAELQKDENVKIPTQKELSEQLNVQ
uniref:Uncharacterized protein n=1 Tax=Panagrolaimus davidi TaxID=227884 RepID=A0A914PMC2_9BILA